MLKPVKKKNLYEDIALQIMQQISAGFYRPGQQLPGERDLSEQLGVNRGSLREAMRVLEFMRVVEKRAGEGVFVKDPALESSLEAMIFRFLAEDGLDMDSLTGACETIVLVESNLARLAARRIDNEGLARLEELTVRMDSLVDDIKAFTDLDQEFHLLVAQLGKSPVLFSVASTMWIIMKRYAGALHSERERRQKCARGHHLIAAAIKAVNEEEAQKEMEHHLKGAVAVLQFGQT